MGCWGAGIFQNDDALDRISNFEQDLSLRLHSFPDPTSLFTTRDALDSGLTVLTFQTFARDGDDLETILFFSAILMSVGAILPSEVRAGLYDRVCAGEFRTEVGAEIDFGIKHALEEYQDGIPWSFDEVRVGSARGGGGGGGGARIGNSPKDLAPQEPLHPSNGTLSNHVDPSTMIHPNGSNTFVPDVTHLDADRLVHLQHNNINNNNHGHLNGADPALDGNGNGLAGFGVPYALNGEGFATATSTANAIGNGYVYHAIGHSNGGA